MVEPNRPEFEILDSEGLEYHRWVSDVETTFMGKDYTSTIIPSTDPNATEPTEKVKANALMFLRRHIDPNLRWEYLQSKTPKGMWDALKGRFGNIHDTLLPELTAQWNEIRLLDYKRVNNYNKDMLRLKARLSLCGKQITEDDMIQKTLSTFPTSALILANQYRLEHDNKRITTFNKLINMLQVAERHDQVLLNNNARPAGTKKVPEANYGQENNERNPKAKGNGHVNQPPRGKNPPRSRGRGQGRGRGRGGSPHAWHKYGGSTQSDHGNIGPSDYNNMSPNKNSSMKRERFRNEPCYRCGDIGHWYQNCRASNKVATIYKRLRDSKEQEAHYIEDGDHDVESNFTIANFDDNKNLATSMDVLD